MKKNVFQGFSENELKNLEMVNGGITYSDTYRDGTKVDENAITAKGEEDPWHGGAAPYTAIDASWDDCGDFTTNPGSGGTNVASGGR